MEEEGQEELLDILGNKTRRMILKSLAEGPRYLLQLAREIKDVTQQAILKQLNLLENLGIISSYIAKSDSGGPPRKYYKLKHSLYLTAGITDSFMDIRALPMEEERTPATESLFHELQKLHQIANPIERLAKIDEFLAKIEDRMKQLDREKVSLLNLKREARRMRIEAMHQKIEMEKQGLTK